MLLGCGIYTVEVREEKLSIQIHQPEGGLVKLALLLLVTNWCLVQTD